MNIDPLTNRIKNGLANERDSFLSKFQVVVLQVFAKIIHYNLLFVTMGARFYVLITLVITLSAYAGLLIFTDGGKDAGSLSFLFPDLTPNKGTESTASAAGNKPAQPNPPVSAAPVSNPPGTQPGTSQPAKEAEQSKPATSK